MNMYATIVPTDDARARASWAQAFEKFAAADRAFEEYRALVWEPLAATMDERAPRPDLWFEVTAKSGQTARFHVSPSKLGEWDDHIFPVFRKKGAAVRDAWLAYRAICEDVGWDAAGQEMDRLCNERGDYESSLIETPAPDQTALLDKLYRLFGPEARDPGQYGASWCPAIIDAVMADAHRLLASRPTLGPSLRADIQLG